MGSCAMRTSTAEGNERDAVVGLREILVHETAEHPNSTGISM